MIGANSCDASWPKYGEIDILDNRISITPWQSNADRLRLWYCCSLVGNRFLYEYSSVDSRVPWAPTKLMTSRTPVVPRNRGGLITQDEERQPRGPFCTAQTKRTVLAISSPGSDLRYCRADAESFAGFLRHRGFQDELWVNRSASKERILQRLRSEAWNSMPNDLFVLFYSGHGFTDVNDKEGLLISDGTKAEVRVLQLDEIRRALRGHRGQVVVVLDACSERLQVSLGQDLSSVLDQDNVLVLSAAGPGTLAYESSELGLGLFTHSLINAMARVGEMRSSQDFLRAFEMCREGTELAAERSGSYQEPARLTMKH